LAATLSGCVRRKVQQEAPMNSQNNSKFDLPERISRVFVISSFVLAIIVSVAAPVLALSYSNIPFPGFLVEQTLVVTNTPVANGVEYPKGIEHPKRVVRIGGVAVATSAEYQSVLRARQVGDQIPVLTRLPDGTSGLFPTIELVDFPRSALLGLFWLPYLIGLVYLIIGLWVYLAQGKGRPGRALAFFCVCTAVVCMLIFDLSSTHLFSALWTFAIAAIGGTIISLGMRFPEEWKPATRQGWLLGLPYLVSIAIGLWGLSVLYSTTRPWAYIDTWQAAYRYDALGVVVFLAIMFYRAFTSQSDLARRQARVVLVGSLIAFIPVTIWFAAPLFGATLPFQGALLLPGLLIFPLSVAVALLKYRLSEADILVGRTVVYGAVTAILAGVFAAANLFSQKAFVAVTGEESNAALVITTLIVASAFTPLRKRMEQFVEARFHQDDGSAVELTQFGNQVLDHTRMSDAELITRRLLEVAVASLQAKSGALSVVADGRLQPLVTSGRWTGEAWLSVPLEYRDARYGMLLLGPRQNGAQYSREEFDALVQAAGAVSRAVWLGTTEQAMPAIRVLRPNDQVRAAMTSTGGGAFGSASRSSS
jgi:hypothetical protein